MRFQIIFVLGFIALASASPLVDKKHASSLKVIDIPADLFADASDNVEDVKKPEEEADAAAAAVPASEVEAEKDSAGKIPEEIPSLVEVVEPKGDEKKEGNIADKNEGEETDRPAIFGFRLPTIVILRRPAIFDDPFSFFPFSINRRPAFGGPLPPPDNRDVDVEGPRPAISADASPSEDRPVSIGNNAGIADIMHGVRQQMDSLFSSLFAPNPGYFPNRQFFPRPFFPSVPSDSSAEEDALDFDKLPNNYKNSTSETKVVDGQVIQVNKTVHKISGNNSNGFFQFSVIKVRPSESPVLEEKPVEAADSIPPAAIETSDAKRESESTTKAQQEIEMNNPSLNEVIDKEEKEAMVANTKYETDAGLLEEPNVPVALPLTEEVIYDFVPLKSMPIIEAKSTKGSIGKSTPHDLSSDLRVNNLMATADNGRLRALVDPDEIEVIEV